MQNQSGFSFSSIKKEEEKYQRKYSQIHQQRSLNSYNPYRKEIVTIQRWFRNILVKNTQVLEAKLQMALVRQQKLEKENREKKRRLSELQNKRQIQLDNKENGTRENIMTEMSEKIRTALSGTLECANRVAYNNSKARFFISQIEQTQNQSEELQGEIKALKL